MTENSSRESSRHAAFGASVAALPKREAFAAERLARPGRLRGVPAPGPDEARIRALVLKSIFSSGLLSNGGRSTRPSASRAWSGSAIAPRKCPMREIDRLKAMIDRHGFVRLPEAPATPARRTIAIGAKVRITGGPFGGMSGLYAGQSTRERELVLLNVLGGQRPVSIAAGLVVPQ